MGSLGYSNPHLHHQQHGQRHLQYTNLLQHVSYGAPDDRQTAQRTSCRVWNSKDSGSCHEHYAITRKAAMVTKGRKTSASAAGISCFIYGEHPLPEVCKCLTDFSKATHRAVV